MQLAYFDDSGSDKDTGILVIGALIVPEDKFIEMEVLVGTVIDDLIPDDKKESFERFHAVELFERLGAFSALPDTNRFDAISKLLGIVGKDTGGLSLPFIYSALDKRAMEKSPFRSANPVDAAFNMCALGVEAWMEANAAQSLCLFMFDDTDDKRLKRDLQTSFRSLRQRIRPPAWTMNRLWGVHDAMYFGSSKDSVGLQITDLCAYFVRRKLSGQTDPRNFFSVVAEQIVCSTVEPEWGQYKGMFMRHT